MRDLSEEKKDIFKNILMILMYVFVYIILSKLGKLDILEFKFIANVYLRGKIQETVYLSIIAILSYIVLNIIFVIKSIFIRPIKIQLEIKDYLREEECTDIYFTNNREGITSKIKLKIKMLNTGSKIAKLMFHIIKNKSIDLLINLSPECKCISFQPERMTEQYKYIESNEGSILSINLSRLIRSNLLNGMYLEETHLITFVREDEERATNNCKYGIKPYLHINNKKLNVILNRLIKLDNGCTDEYYKVNLIVDRGDIRR